MAILNPYLSFTDTAREAMEFYQSVFGGELTASTFADYQTPGVSEEESAKIMHSQLTTPAGFTLMGADTPSSFGSPSANGSISLSGEETEELRGYWDKLAEGGSVTMPMDASPWGDTFGMLTDKFGVCWLVNIAGSGSGS